TLDSADSPLAELTEDALHAARRARDLVRQLTTFAGHRPAASSSHELAPIIDRAVSMCRRTFEQHVRIHARVGHACARLVCDPAEIEQMVVHLLINARDAVADAGRDTPRIDVDVSARSELPENAPRSEHEAHVRIRIQDNGTGMNDAVKERVF